MTHDVAMEAESQFLLLGNVFFVQKSWVGAFLQSNLFFDSNISRDLNSFLPGRLQCT